MLGLSIASHAQTGPGGVGNALGIKNQPANSLWLDAAVLELEEGLSVAQWTDRSGNDFHASQESSSRQPVFLPGGAFNISMPVVRFTSNNQNFLNFSGNTVVGTNYTVFIIAANRTGGNQWVIGGSGSGNNNNLHFGWNSNTQYKYHHWGNDYTSIPLINGQPGTGSGSFGIMTLLNNKSLDDRYVYQNNQLLGSGANPADLNSWTGAGIGAYNTSYSNIDVAEVIFFRAALNQAQLQIVNQYFNVKYNIPIFNDLYSPTAGYTFSMAGIGRTAGGAHNHASSDGFYLTALTNSLQAGEFVFTSHNNLPNTADNFTSENTPSEVMMRYNRIWNLKANGSISSLQLGFDITEAVAEGDYPGEAEGYVLLYRSNDHGNFEIVKPAQGIQNGTRVYFNLAGAGETRDGFYTLGTTNTAESPLQGKPGQTWFTLMSGNWDNWETWTLDPAGAISYNPQQLTPTSSPSSFTDHVVILNGKTVNLTSNDKQNATLTVNGRLDINTTTGHNFGEIKGNGRILLKGDNFPSGNAHHFITPGQGQGTVIYQGNDYILAEERTFFNVELDLSSENSKIILRNDYNIQGDLLIKKGALQINDDHSTQILNLTIANNVRVEALGKILTGEGDTRQPYQIGSYMPSQDGKLYHSIFHQMVIRGNLINNGHIRFTNLQAPLYDQFPTNGAVTVTFSNATNNTAIFNGPAHFYNLIIDKGADKTYQLEIVSSSPENFILFGANKVGRNTLSGHDFTSENPQVRKALWIRTGTLKLSGKIHIPTLSEGSSGGQAGGNGDYAIGQNARLWIASPEVTVYSSVSNQNQIPGFESAVNTGITTNGSNQALSLYGEFRITDGFFGTRQSAGFIFWPQANAQVKIEGGTVNVSQFRSGGGQGVASYTQTGGLLKVRGSETEAGEVANGYPMFGFENENGVFNMSGGEIRFHDVTTNSANNGFYIPSMEGNYHVSGGKITVDIPSGKNFTFNSTAPVYNVEIRRLSGSGQVTASLSKDLHILNDLDIQPNTIFTAQNQQNNVFDLYVGRHFDLRDGGQYLAHNNTTYFTRNQVSRIFVRNTTNSGELVFHDLHIIKDQPWNPSTFRSVEVHSNGRNGDIPPIIVNGKLWIERGQLDLRTFALSAKGNVEISDGRIFSSNSTNPGRLIVNGPDRQTIKGSPSKQLDFGNLELNNNRGADLESHIAVVDFHLTTGIMNLGVYNLRIAGVLYPEAEFDQDRMFQTEGNASDGGLSLRISENNNYLFPIGTNSKDFVRYTPLVATFKDVTSAGFVTLSVAARSLASLDALDKNDALRYYWYIRHSGFGEELPTIESYVFTCSLTDYPGNNPWGGNWRPGKVVDITRSSEKGSNLSGANITFNSGFKLEEGSYTAAEQNAFTGNLRVFYSRGGQGMKDWSKRETWSYEGHNGNQVPNASSHRPGPGDIVIIGYNPNGVNQYHWVRMDQPNIEVAEIRFAGDGITWNPRLYINAGDFQILGKVSGRGDIRLNVRPGQIPIVRGDLGDFLEGGQNFFAYHLDENGHVNIPSNIDVYPNLRIESTSNSLGARTISFESDIHVKRNMIIDGSSIVIVHTGTNGNITIDNNLNIGGYQAGRLQFPSSGPNKTITVNNNLWIRDDSNNSIQVLNNNPNNLKHKLQVGGNIIHDNGSIMLFTNNNNGNNVELELMGNTSADYTRNGGNEANLYRLIMNKNATGLVTFSFLNSFQLRGPNDGNEKALTLLSGRLGLRNSSIDLTLNSGGSDFKIPAGSELWLGSGSTVRISGNNTGIWLDGKLTIGNGVNAYFNEGQNNYIEYTASGNSEIDINSGNSTLLVGSQIRRSTQTEEGILNFRLRHAGAHVVIGTQAGNIPENNRGILEILNAQSNLEMAPNSTLIIANAQNNPLFPSVYFNPASYSLGQGSQIRFGDAHLTQSGQEIGLFSEIPLKNLYIHNELNNKPALKLWHKGIMIEENLEITPNAEFRAEGWNVEIRGNWVNLGNYISGTNTTIFSGNENQEIIGETTFWNFHKTTSHALHVRNNLVVQNNFSLQAGIFSDNSNEVTVRGHVVNNAIHQWGGTGNGITLAGSYPQNMVSTGEWGKITINNPSGVQVETSNHQIVINDAVKLTSGVFDIGRNLLLLKENATFIEGNTYSEANMVQSNLSFTDNGIKKIFPANYTGSFVYPIGSMFKYTPVILNDLATGAGSLRVKAANEIHPTIINENDGCMENTKNALKYHWTFEAADGLNNFTANASMKYYKEDAVFTAPNTLADYITARLIMGSDQWNKFDQSSFDHQNDIMHFSFNAADASGINGDYTAGVRADCGDAIPDNIPVYISVNSGNWSNAANWAVYNTDTHQAGEPGVDIPTGGPRGVIAIIDDNDQITMDQNFINNYRTIINGVLDVNTSYAQRIGIVEGSGELYTQRGDLPAAVYDHFIQQEGSIFHFGGNTDYDVLNQLPMVNNVKFSGTGQRRLPNLDFLVRGNLEIDGSGDLYIINEHNRKMNVKGDMIFNNGWFVSGYGNSQVILDGLQRQTIKGNQSFIGDNSFWSIEVNNPAGVRLENSINIKEQLTMKTGIINSQSHIVSITNPALNAVTGFSANSYIAGPVTRTLSGVMQKYSFPTGNSQRYRNASVFTVTHMFNQPFTIEYFGQNPTLAGMDSYEYDSMLESVNNREYWRIEGPSESEAQIELSWGLGSGVPEVEPEMLENHMAIAVWNNTLWESMGQSAAYAANNGTGTVLSLSTLTFADKSANRFVTTASTDRENLPLPIELLSFTASKADKRVDLEWATAAEINNDFFTIERSRNGVDYEVINIIPSKAQNGHSNTVLLYNISDLKPLEGLAYYRLKQTDFDGSFEYSDPVSVNFETDNTQVSFNVFPNPNRGVSFRMVLNGLPANETMDVMVADLSGRSVYSTRIQSDFNGSLGAFIVPNGRLSKGVYMVTVAGKSGNHSMRLMVQ
ncbi:MAG: T9SS C-terminal target domain-containing protein [Bacteroidetes bacterium]|nr:MAG: T9SS C-terminal target domain-containing protein [Bacteroidota bacterium]